jgi:hypothetical protein
LVAASPQVSDQHYYTSVGLPLARLELVVTLLASKLICCGMQAMRGNRLSRFATVWCTRRMRLWKASLNAACGSETAVSLEEQPTQVSKERVTKLAGY